MKLFVSYLKEHFLIVAGYLVFWGIFALVFYLGGIPKDIVNYAFLLGAAWIACVTGVGFYRYRKRHCRILELELNIADTWEGLPKTQSVVEQDYQRVLEKIFAAKKEQEADYILKKQDMLDYYSLWAHQIKTPIAAMRVLLQSQEEEIQSSEYMRALKIELFKVEQYVDMVLSYLRMESISSDMLLKNYKLAELVRQAVRKYSQMFIAQGIHLEMEVGDDYVLTDKKWLMFVIEQILSNALKYTKKGTIYIYQKKISETSDERNLELIIEDTGIGIRPEDIPRVFERGFTGYNGRSDKKSTGIGLYLSKSVVDKLGHRISIESEVGKGTKVKLCLGRRKLHVE